MTIRELIAQLNEIENKDLPVVFTVTDHTDYVIGIDSIIGTDIRKVEDGIGDNDLEIPNDEVLIIDLGNV
jgi:hypothetical protein